MEMNSPALWATAPGLPDSWREIGFYISRNSRFSQFRLFGLFSVLI
jgi:hypothetical protein